MSSSSKQVGEVHQGASVKTEQLKEKQENTQAPLFWPSNAVVQVMKPGDAATISLYRKGQS